jgi:hypothetical protein
LKGLLIEQGDWEEPDATAMTALSTGEIVKKGGSRSLKPAGRPFK